MFGWFRRKLQVPLHSPRQAALPADTRIYAVGDIHGRCDLLLDLLARIEADCASAPARRQIVFLGDYIDRGPDSKGVLERLRQPMPADLEPVFLMGNHESAFLRLFSSLETGPGWLIHGGLETLKSYGLPLAPGQPTAERLLTLQETLLERFPPDHRTWLESCRTFHESGDYYFVHAGIRPDVPLAGQSDQDRLWIRQGFVDWRGGHLEKMIVHGHTISREVELMPYRIGIDTGAYASGRLTALVLEDTTCRILQTGSGQNQG